jgi:hypothetical protein
MTQESKLLTDEEQEALDKNIDEQSEMFCETLTEDVDDGRDGH